MPPTEIKNWRGETKLLADKRKVFMHVRGSENKMKAEMKEEIFYFILKYVSWLKPRNQSKCFNSVSVSVKCILHCFISRNQALFIAKKPAAGLRGMWESTIF